VVNQQPSIELAVPLDSENWCNFKRQKDLAERNYIRMMMVQKNKEMNELKEKKAAEEKVKKMIKRTKEQSERFRDEELLFQHVIRKKGEKFAKIKE
jgi:hypothetical protein